MMLQFQRLYQSILTLTASVAKKWKYTEEKLAKLGYQLMGGKSISETSNNTKANMISKEQAIKSTNGRFFSVMYRNKLGDVSRYVVRTGVKKDLKGGTNHAPKGTVTLYAVSKDGDRSNFGYRTLYLDNIREMSMQNWELYSMP
jgi:hypothetical protein